MMIVEYQVRGDERTCITLDEQAKELLFGLIQACPYSRALRTSASQFDGSGPVLQN
jgi:hypothetical protein